MLLALCSLGSSMLRRVGWRGVQYPNSDTLLPRYPSQRKPRVLASIPFLFFLPTSSERFKLYYTVDSTLAIVSCPNDLVLVSSFVNHFYHNFPYFPWTNHEIPLPRINNSTSFVVLSVVLFISLSVSVTRVYFSGRHLRWVARKIIQACIRDGCHQWNETYL